MKKNLFFFLWYISLITTAFADYKNDMLPWNNGWAVSVLVEWNDGEKQVDNILAWFRDSIDTLLPIAAIGVFLFVGIRLWIARWNPDEFKKSWMQFIYAVIGIFVVSFAWAAVKIVSGFTIFN